MGSVCQSEELTVVRNDIGWKLKEYFQRLIQLSKSTSTGKSRFSNHKYRTFLHHFCLTKLKTKYKSF